MHASHSGIQLKLDNVLVATDFSAPSKKAVVYATSIARRHRSKLFIAHVVTSRSESALMEGWRVGQMEITEHLLADRLDGIQHKLIVKSGSVWAVLSQLIAEKEVDLVVVGTRGRTGVRKRLLGSVAESIFRQAPCPVLIVGPHAAGQDPEIGPERILAATGFAAHSVAGVRYAIGLAGVLHSSLALLNVVTAGGDESVPAKDTVKKERLSKLRTLIPSDVRLASEPMFFVEFGSALERILEKALTWKANLIVLGLRHVAEGERGETTWAKAYEIVSKAICPVFIIRGPE